MDTDLSKISARVLTYLHNPTCTVYLSLASVWEMVIKNRKHDLHLTDTLENVIAEHLSTTPIKLLPISLDHILKVDCLPSIHRDPFDRMLVAQVMVENAVILTTDSKIIQYPIRTDW